MQGPQKFPAAQPVAISTRACWWKAPAVWESADSRVSEYLGAFSFGKRHWSHVLESQVFRKERTRVDCS